MKHKVRDIEIVKEKQKEKEKDDGKQKQKEKESEKKQEKQLDLKGANEKSATQYIEISSSRAKN